MGKKTKAPLILLSDYQKRYNAEAEKLKNVLGSRIAQARKDKGLSLAAFSERLKTVGVTVSGGGINKWEGGNTVPNAYQLIAICVVLGLEKELPYFMGEYQPLLNQEGLRKLEEYRADLVATGKYRPTSVVKNTIRYIEKPVSTLAVSAGAGEFLDEQNFEMVEFPEGSVPAEAEFGIRVSGDSMEPVYHDGQIVWVKRTNELSVGDVGIFVCNGEGYLKVYGEQQPPEDEEDSYKDEFGTVHPQVVMISYNQAYEPKAVTPDSDFMVVGKVL